MRGASSPDRPYLRIDLARSNGYQANNSSSYLDPVSTGDKLTFAMMLGHNATLGLARGAGLHTGVRFDLKSGLTIRHFDLKNEKE